MKYMSVDLETTGLTPMLHGITEFAAVFADDQSPGTPPKAFYRWVNPDGYVWSAYCLGLHKGWIERVLDRMAKKQYAFGPADRPNEPKIVANIAELIKDFMKWYEEVDPEGFSEHQLKLRGNITGTGKNFGTFDLQFLKAWKFPDVFRHRVLEWIPNFTIPDDKVPPDLKLCKERAILMGCPGFEQVEVAHNALDDAMDVYKLVQFGATLQTRHKQILTMDPRN